MHIAGLIITAVHTAVPTHLLPLQKSLNHMWMYGNTSDNEVSSPGRTPIIYRKVIMVIRVISTPPFHSPPHPLRPRSRSC